MTFSSRHALQVSVCERPAAVDPMPIDRKFMSSAAPADTGGMAQWQFFSNHMHVLTAIAQRPDLRLREIAREVGITERATHRIVTELVDEGYLTRTRIGSRNRYEILVDAPLRHPVHAQHNVEQIVRLLTATDDADATDARARLDPQHDPALDGSETFREVFLAAPAGMAVNDRNGRFLAVNPAFCRIVDRSEKDLLGRDFREVTHPDDIPADEDGLKELASDERSEYVREKRYIRPDGTLTWVKLRVAATAHPETGACMFVANVVDISERKRQDQALSEAEDRFRSAFDNAPIGMALVAPDGRFIKVNRSLCEITGHPETALLVRTFQSITHPDDLDTDLAFVHDVLAGTRRTYQMEKRYYHAHGHVIWVMLSVSLVRDVSGDPLYFISQIEDITQRKQREQALKAQPPPQLGATDHPQSTRPHRASDLAIDQHMPRGA
jgi:PAS domain S-box-containing protein